jgi:hypothetical protein
MKQPFRKLSSVYEMDYKKRTKDIVIYQYCETSYDEGYCSHCDKKTCKGQCLYYAWNKGYKDQPATPNIQLSKITLQSLLDMLPEGVKPSDVKISIESDDWSGVPYRKVSFFYKKTFPADMEQYKKDKAAADADYAEWEQKQLAYEKWLKEQEIKKLEAELEKLKK